MDETNIRYARAEALQVTETDDGLIVFNPQTDRVHHLNFTAGALFEFCESTATQAELVAKMADLFALEEPPVEDVDACLQQLVADGLLNTDGS